MKTPHHHPRFCTLSCFLLSLRAMTEDHTSLVLEHRFPPTLIYVCFMKVQRTVLTSFTKSACTGDCIMIYIPLHNTTHENIVVYLFLDCRPYSWLRYGKDYICFHMQTTTRASAPMRRAEAPSLPRRRCKHRLQTPPQRSRHHSPIPRLRSLHHLEAVRTPDSQLFLGYLINPRTSKSD